MGLRRFVFFTLVILTIGWGIGTMFNILSANGTTPIEAVILVLFGLAFGWISISFWTAIAGSAIALLRRDPTTLRKKHELAEMTSDVKLITRTAVVMPIYNEDPARVLAGIESTYRSLAATGEIGNFDLYILSDTRDPEIAARESEGWARLCDELGAEGRLFYRRRQDNRGRKAGNVADFCERWGYRYDGMVVLDADSIMSGTTIVALARALQTTPQAGIIQTVPLPVRQETLFGRFIQFASRLYSPILAGGLAFWQFGEANYWGHNAIIRLSAFTRHCGLPLLPGAPPLGGEILSHDFVEAAFLRRSHWKTYLLPDLDGSFEEIPSNILDFAKRDRRWAQGNIQHIKLLMLRGLHPLSRLHFTLGALAYGSSLIWLLLLVLSTIDALNRALRPANFFGVGFQLFPDWTVVDENQILSLISVTIVMLLLPKVLIVLATCLEARLRRSFGGVRLLFSAVLEIVFSVILAPLMMTLHSYFVASILAGRNVSWDPQNRTSEGLTLGESARPLIIPTILGIAWGTLTYLLSPLFFWWLSPVIVGLVVAIPLCAWSSRVSAGTAMRRMGILLTPEEIAPPAEINQVAEVLQRDDSTARARRNSPWPRAFPSEVHDEMKPQRLEYLSLAAAWRRWKRGARPSYRR